MRGGRTGTGRPERPGGKCTAAVRACISFKAFIGFNAFLAFIGFQRFVFLRCLLVKGFVLLRCECLLAEPTAGDAMR